MEPVKESLTLDLSVISSSSDEDCAFGVSADARIDAESFSRLGLEDGDLIEIVGRKTTAAVARSAPPGEPSIALGDDARENAGVIDGDHARVRAIEAPAADWAVFAPSGPAPDGDALAALHRLLQGRPIRDGDRLRASVDDVLLDLRVVSSAPSGPATIEATTQIMLGGRRREDFEDTGWRDVGGLAQQIARIREIVELPLLRPEIFARLGIRPPKGVLLHGPPGCGKTLLARAIAHEVDASFHAISGPEVIHKFYGESEAHLRGVFEEAAQSAPAIIFFDEIDAIAPARDRAGGEVEKRVVAQLLAVMDGLARRDRVVVLAATNLPNSLDPALRRPGRFDREIAIPVPDRKGRREILAVHSREMPLADDVDLDALADITHGFVGADLAAFCREAAMHRLRRTDLDAASANTDGSGPGTFLTEEQLDALEIEAADFLAALRDVQPSALREVTIEAPETRWSDLGGLDEVIERLRTVFEWPLRHRDLFEAAAIGPARGILLHGPPGCGKTLIARALASESGVNFLAVQGPELLAMHVGESEERVRSIFRKARRASPAILMFDEIDALLPARDAAASSTGRSAERVLSQFLAELDGIEDLQGVVVVGATNRPDLLDPALLRPGRFDEVLEIPLPDLKARREILAVHRRGKPFAEEPDLERLAGECKGLSGAALADVFRQAAILAIARLVADAGAAGDEPRAEDLRIEADDLRESVERAMSRQS